MKLRLVAESMPLACDALLAWCKQKGITMDELLAWRDLALSGIEEAAGSVTGNSRGELEDMVKNLSTNIRRKNDALAEATALLVLKKNGLLKGISDGKRASQENS